MSNENNNDDIPPVEELNQLLEVAIKASKEAGQILLSNINGEDSGVTKLKANPRDLLTKIDPLCESVIKDIILSTYPTHDFLGEEDVDPGKDASANALESKLNGSSEDGGSDYLWIVDPIDGMCFVLFCF
jgi:myo-inositol-1(or 4)-monophosphatase